MTRKAWIAGLLAILVAGLYFLVPSREQRDLMRRGHQIRDVLLACKVYAIQHGGQMPQKLEEVVEAYGQARGTAPNRYLARAITELEFRTPGINTKEADSGTVVLREKCADGKGRRMFGFLGGNIGMLQDQGDQDLPPPAKSNTTPSLLIRTEQKDRTPKDRAASGSLHDPQISYDEKGRMTECREFNPDGSVKSTTTYRYLPNGFLDQTTIEPHPDRSRTETYVHYPSQDLQAFKSVKIYDAQGKLLSEKLYSNSPGTVFRASKTPSTERK